MKLKFPEFADTENGTIEFAIEEARLGVGSNWTKGYNVAIMYLAAHYIQCGITAAASIGGGGGDIASESIGRLSVTYRAATVNTSADVSTLASTSYGSRYEELRDANFGGPVIV
jgi:hypothetical protein